MYRLLLTLVASMAIVGSTLVFALRTQAGDKSDAKVKATAMATKLSPDGKQTVTLTLDVEKGWYIYANPMNANTDVLDGNQTRVSFKAKENVPAEVKYPKGKQKVDGKYMYNIYEGTVVIETQIRRSAGDTTPLRVSIDVNACRKGECLLPGTVVLTVP